MCNSNSVTVANKTKFLVHQASVRIYIYLYNWRKCRDKPNHLFIFHNRLIFTRVEGNQSLFPGLRVQSRLTGHRHTHTHAIHSNAHTYSPFRIQFTSHACFRTVGETGNPGRNPQHHEENTQTPHTQEPDSNPKSWSFEGPVIPTVEPKLI